MNFLARRHICPCLKQLFFYSRIYFFVSSCSLECPVHAFHLLLNFVVDGLCVTSVLLLTVSLNVAQCQLQLPMLAYCQTLKLEVVLNLGRMSFNSTLVTSWSFSVPVGKSVTYPEKAQRSPSLQHGAVVQSLEASLHTAWLCFLFKFLRGGDPSSPTPTPTPTPPLCHSI